MGKMEFAGLQRGLCAWGASSICPQDHKRDKEDYQNAITTHLQENLLPGDVVAIIAAADSHLYHRALGWYSDFVIPLLSSKNTSLLLLQDWVYATPPCAHNPRIHSCNIYPHHDHLRAKATCESFASGKPDVYCLSFAPLFCSVPFSALSVCNPAVPGTSLSSLLDGSHLSALGSMYLWPFACAAFRQFGFFT